MDIDMSALKKARKRRKENTLQRYEKEITQLKQQRDELLEASKKVAKLWYAGAFADDEDFIEAVEILCNKVNKIEGDGE